MNDKIIAKELVKIAKSLKAREIPPELAPSGIKEYNWMMHVGKAKYVVNYHDGVDAHKDGSKFYNIATFSNKKDFKAFLDKLQREGYREKEFPYTNIKFNKVAI